MHRIRPALDALATAIADIVWNRIVWSTDKALTVLAAVGLMTLIDGQPPVHPDVVTVTVAALFAADVIAWFMHREYDRRQQRQEA